MTLADALLLFLCMPSLKMILPRAYFRGFPWVNYWFDAFQILPPDKELENPFAALPELVNNLLENKHSVAIFLRPKEKFSAEIKKAIEDISHPIFVAQLKKESIAKRFLGVRYRQVLVTMSFSKQE